MHPLSATTVGMVAIALCGLLPGLYYLWLELTKGEEWATRQLYEYGSDGEFRETEAGGVGVTQTQDGCYHFQIYRFDE